MAHLCVPQNQALGVCRGFVPDIQVCGTHWREDLVNATITSNAEGEEEVTGRLHSSAGRLGDDRDVIRRGCTPHLSLLRR